MGSEKRFTIEKVREIIEEFGYELFSEKYKNAQQKLILKDNEGYFYYITYGQLKNDRIPDKFHKSNPYTIQNMKLWLILNQKPFKLVSEEYKSGALPSIFKDDEGYYYYARFTHIQEGIKPSKFNKSNPYTIQNIKLWYRLNNKPYELISDKYEGNDKHLQWQCFKEDCGEMFDMCWHNIQNDYGCPFCANQKVYLGNCLVTKNPELAKEFHPTKNGDLTVYDFTVSSGKEVWWECRECNHEWMASIGNRNNNNQGCPDCSSSKGEKKCKEIFIYKNFIEISQNDYNKLLDKNNNVYFIPQKTFKGLVGLGNGLLSYDFYLSTYNLLIEYQGQFHDGSSGEYSKINLKQQVEHDKRKKQYTIQNKYNFLEIWYYDFDKIETILTNYLQKLDQELSANKDSSFYLPKKEVI